MRTRSEANCPITNKDAGHSKGPTPIRLRDRIDRRATIGIFAVATAIGLLLPAYRLQAGIWRFVWMGITGVASIIGGVWTVTEVVDGPGDITGRVKARPQLRDPTVTIEATSAYQGSAMGAGPHGYTNIHGDYKYHDYLFTFVHWDPEAEEYVQGEQHRTSGDTYMSQADFEKRITAERETKSWWRSEFTSPGSRIVTGTSLRYTCGAHTIQSKISGGWFRNPDGELATTASALNYSYTVRLHFDRKKMEWDDVNHRWKSRPWMAFTASEAGVSATTLGQWDEDIVDDDTQVTNEKVRGGSDLYWRENRTHSEVMVPMEYYDDHGLPTGHTRLVKVPKITKTYRPAQRTQ